MLQRSRISMFVTALIGTTVRCPKGRSEALTYHLMHGRANWNERARKSGRACTAIAYLGSASAALTAEHR